jgi:hypothetical protein
MRDRGVHRGRRSRGLEPARQCELSAMLKKEEVIEEVLIFYGNPHLIQHDRKKIVHMIFSF